VQHFALAPNNMTDAPAWAIDFMKQVPTTWDETRFIDGYPGQYVVMARRSGDKWYVVGISADDVSVKNGKTQPRKLTLPLEMFPQGTSLNLYTDDASLNGSVKTVAQNKKQSLVVTIPKNGGFVITQK
jgi:hypothetical protein